MPASTANWEFHRANFARNRPNYTIEEYSCEFGLNYNTARVRLRGAKHDENCMWFDFTGLNKHTGERLARQPVKSDRRRW